MSHKTASKPKSGKKPSALMEDMFQVILYNDNYNTVDHVIKALMQVFGHPEQLAFKIMKEAHLTGKAVADVESEAEAKLHRDQLQSLSLTATVEKI